MKLKVGIFACLAMLGALLGAAESMDSSPWVGWHKGYDSYDRATESKERGDYDRAIELYGESKEYFSTLSRNFPDWNKAVIKGRIDLCDKEIAKLRKMTGRPATVAAKPAATPVAAETPATTPAAAPSTRRPSRRPAATESEPAEDWSDEDFEEPVSRPAARPTRRKPRRSERDYDDWGGDSRVGSGRLTIELEAELTQYRQRLRNALQEIDSLQLKLQKAELRARDVSGLMRDYRQLQEKYDLLKAQYEEVKTASAVPDGDIEKLEAQVVELKMANDEAQRSIRKLNADVSARDEEYAKSRQEVLALKENARKSENENKRMARELERAKNSGTSPAELNQLKAKVAAQGEELTQKEQEIAALLARLSAPGGAGNADDLKEIARLRNEIANLKASGTAETQLRNRIGVLTAENERYAKQLQEDDLAFKQRDKEYAALLEASKQQSSANSVQTAELKSLRQHSADLETEVKTWSQRYADLEKRYRTNRASASLDFSDSDKSAALTRDLETAEADKKALTGQLGELKKELEAAQNLVKESREAVLESKSKELAHEVEKEKMAALQKAYDELKVKMDLIQKASDSDVLETLKRIPGLEESLRRYDAENKALLAELNALKLAAQSGTKVDAKADAPKSSAELEKIETLLADARAAEARTNFEVAIWGYRQVLGRDAENVEASRNLGMILLDRHSFDEAAALLKRAWKSEPSNLRTADALARALIGKRDYAGALEVIAEVKAENPGKNEKSLLITEALAYSRSGKNAEAEKAFKAVLNVDANNVEAAHELALLLSADEARRKEAGEYYLLAKEHGGEVDSYLEEILKSVTGTDRATIDFLKKSAVDALNGGDMSSAEWYIGELGKMADDDPAAARLNVLRELLTGKADAALAALPKEDAGRSDCLLRAAVLVANQRNADAEKVLNALPEGKVAPELAVLKGYLAKLAEKMPDAKALIEALQKAL